MQPVNVPPLSHDPRCPTCAPHPWHLLICLHDGVCACAAPPVPGIYAEPSLA